MRSARRGAVLGATIAVAGAAFACRAPASPAGTSTTAAPAAADQSAGSRRATLAVHCYETRTADGSVFSFQYTDYVGEVVGILDYAFHEKDGAHGTFRGRRAGDLITARWTHTVEGTTQTQEVLIRLEGDRAVKANGDLAEGPDGVLRLKDSAAAVFNEAFARVQCD
jgi:hypothetical protein